MLVIIEASIPVLLMIELLHREIRILPATRIPRSFDTQVGLNSQRYQYHVAIYFRFMVLQPS